MNSYEKKLAEQKTQYECGEQIHDLPDIFHLWSAKYLRPKLNEVFGCSSVTDFYANAIESTLSIAGVPRNIISIGSGDCTLEASIVEELIKRGVSNFKFECLEISPNLIKLGRDRINQLNLEGFFILNEVDINIWAPSQERSYGVAMANHSLHHIVELERLFNGVFAALDYRGSFVINDMIGRNGHMRWPEVLVYVEAIWKTIAPEKKFNHQSKQQHNEYINFDCSNHGFEGVRAQDILPILLKNFGFSKFLAFGGLTEVFFDRGYGNNFYKNNELDMNFVDLIALLNEKLIDGGLIKPTMMFAELKVSPCSTKAYRHWLPDFCVRLP